jgi:hypothetical protein
VVSDCLQGGRDLMRITAVLQRYAHTFILS